MRKILVAAAASAAIVTTAGLVVDRADAMTLTAQSGVQAAADSTNLAQDVRWVCRYHWNGRRSCWWEPSHRRSWRYRHW